MDNQFELIKQVEKPVKKILFIGYDNKSTKLIDELIDNKCEVWHTNKKFNKIEFFDLIISFGYRHLIKKDFLKLHNIPIINLHISYLPWNKGSHPNFWSLFEDTPSGVTIHLVDEGIDTGDIIYQRKVIFKNTDNTFEKTYKKLFAEIESLFIENIQNIIFGQYIAKPQTSGGSYHSSDELPDSFRGWHANINEEIERLKGES